MCVSVLSVVACIDGVVFKFKVVAVRVVFTVGEDFEVVEIVVVGFTVVVVGGVEVVEGVVDGVVCRVVERVVGDEVVVGVVVGGVGAVVIVGGGDVFGGTVATAGKKLLGIGISEDKKKYQLYKYLLMDIAV